MSSPPTLDLNNDGYDEVIAVSNLSWDLSDESPVSQKVKSQLAIFDGNRKEKVLTLDFQGFSAVTPTVSDIDQNNKLDMIHAYAGHVVRIELEHAALPRKSGDSYQLFVMKIRKSGDRPATTTRGTNAS